MGLDVAVTGIGVVSALGATPKELVDRLIAGDLLPRASAALAGRWLRLSAGVVALVVVDRSGSVISAHLKNTGPSYFGI